MKLEMNKTKLTNFRVDGSEKMQRRCFAVEPLCRSPFIVVDVDVVDVVVVFTRPVVVCWGWGRRKPLQPSRVENEANNEGK